MYYNQLNRKLPYRVVGEDNLIYIEASENKRLRFSLNVLRIETQQIMGIVTTEANIYDQNSKKIQEAIIKAGSNR